MDELNLKDEYGAILKEHALWLSDNQLGTQANLRSANLYAANLRSADLRSADLQSADLQNVRLPSPTMVLMASWGELSDELTADAMAYDAACHPDPTRFDEWVATNTCPYNSVLVQRACNFNEKKELWDPERPSPRPYDLMVRILKECCTWTSG